MGQIEVYEFLKAEKLKGNEKFFSASEIYKLMKEQGLEPGHKNALYVALIQLERFEYVDIEMQGSLRDWHRLYRIKSKYCEKPIIENQA